MPYVVIPVTCDKPQPSQFLYQVYESAVLAWQEELENSWVEVEYKIVEVETVICQGS